MPTYEYECKNCGHTFEVFQSMSEPPLKNCPQCGQDVRRLIHGGSGIIFKGSGFYVTDKKGGGGVSGGGKTSPKTETAPGGQKPASPASSAGADSSTSGKGSAPSGGGPAAGSGSGVSEKKAAG